MGEKLSGTPSADLEKAYHRFREQVKDENELYNHRIVWLISMNAFLFATIGLILQAKFPETSVVASLYLEAVMFLFAAVGIFVSLVAWRLLGNARSVLNEIEAQWNDYLDDLGMKSEQLLAFPHVRGGSGKSQAAMILRSANLPFMFVITWAIFIMWVIAGIVLRSVGVLPLLAAPG
jgi:hypothetical protein